MNILAATLNNSSSSAKPTRREKLPGQTFCGTLEHGFIIEPEDDQLTLLQSDLWRKIDAFYRFSRPHTVIGTVSGSYIISIDKGINAMPLRSNLNDLYILASRLLA